MAEYIGCRDCASPDCKGCNLKNLETMLKSGKFDCLMNGNRCISVDSEAVPVRRGYWLEAADNTHFCSECGFDALYERYDDLAFRENLTDVCPHCGAIMGGISDE